MKAACIIHPEDFVDDRPFRQEPRPAMQAGGVAIDGVRLTPLVGNPDDRGELFVLLTVADVDLELGPVQHVYSVTAEPGSIRAWVFHKRQHDRLAYFQGDFRVVLYDIRAESPTFGRLQVLDVGADNPVRLVIPPFVVHGVQNRGSGPSSFVNMPTRPYDPANPDKSRLPWDHPGIPYDFAGPSGAAVAR